MTTPIQDSTSRYLREMCTKGFWKHAAFKVDESLRLDIIVRNRCYVMEVYSELVLRPPKYCEFGDLYAQLDTYSTHCAVKNAFGSNRLRGFVTTVSPLTIDYPLVTLTDYFDSRYGKYSRKPRKRSFYMRKVNIVTWKEKRLPLSRKRHYRCYNWLSKRRSAKIKRSRIRCRCVHKSPRDQDDDEEASYRHNPLINHETPICYLDADDISSC